MKEKLEVIDVGKKQNVLLIMADLISRSIKDHFRDRGETLKILEAGCGNRWSLDLTPLDFRLTGLDVSSEALAQRKIRENDLDEILVGDLETVELPEASYDMVYSSYVLEHLRNAEAVLSKMMGWIKPGGLLALIIPDKYSVKGFLTRTTPYWVHLLFVRHIRDFEDAGKPGNPPFRICYDDIVSRRGIVDYCSRNGHGIIVERGVNPNLGQDFGALSPLVRLGTGLIAAASLGRLTTRHTDLVYVIEKAGRKTASA